MYFDTFTQLVVLEEGDKDLYSQSSEAGLPLNEFSSRLFYNENLVRKSSIRDVLPGSTTPLSDTTHLDIEIYRWISECKSRLFTEGTSFSKPWIFQVDPSRDIKEQASSLFPFQNIRPYFITEDMLQESLGINTLLVNKGFVCVLQKENQGIRYKPFSSPLFTKGGTCDIFCTYTQSVRTTNRSYAIIGITTQDYSSAIKLAGVFPSLHDWQHAQLPRKHNECN